MKIKAIQLRKGNVIIYNDDLFILTDVSINVLIHTGLS